MALGSLAPIRVLKPTRLRKLNIGSGRAPLEGYENCDLHAWPGVDHAFDAQKRWPFEDDSVGEIYLGHVLEHFADHDAFFREAWRVMAPGAKLALRVPHGWHQSCWWDFTHLRPWLQESFASLQPGFVKFTRNNQHESPGYAFWVQSCVMVFDMPWARMWRFKPLRPLCRWAGRHLLNVYRELVVEMTKTTHDDPASAAHGGDKHPAVVPCSWGVLRHEYEGKSGDGLSHHELVIFTGHEGAIAGNE